MVCRAAFNCKSGLAGRVVDSFKCAESALKSMKLMTSRGLLARDAT